MRQAKKSEVLDKSSNLRRQQTHIYAILASTKVMPSLTMPRYLSHIASALFYFHDGMTCHPNGRNHTNQGTLLCSKHLQAPDLAVF